MKAFAFKALALLSILSPFAVSCSKELAPDSGIETPTSQKEEFQPSRLVSATKTSVVSVSSIYDKVVEDVKSQDFFTVSILDKDIIDLDIVTYRISYNSTVHKDGVDCPAVLEGDVSFLIDNNGYISKRYIESISLFNCPYYTSALDVTCHQDFDVNLRSIHNTMVIYPFYQGCNQVNSNEGIVVAPGEFVYKGKQAIDCVLAAIEFVEQLPDVSLMCGYYTDNFGFSNGGGTALAIPYLLENDEEYMEFASTVNLRSSYVAEGNCSNVDLFNNIIKEYGTEDGDSSLGISIDVNKLAAVGYISTVAGTFMTWQKEYFEGVNLQDYFSECGRSYLERYLANNNTSLLFEAFEEIFPTIFEVINPDLYLQDVEGNYHFDMTSELMQKMYKAFDENEVILSGWCPKSPLKIVHSTGDSFLPYKNNFNIWKDLSLYGFNQNVKLETLYGLDHLTATVLLIYKDFVLKKNSL